MREFFTGRKNLILMILLVLPIIVGIIFFVVKLLDNTEGYQKEEKNFISQSIKDKNDGSLVPMEKEKVSQNELHPSKKPVINGSNHNNILNILEKSVDNFFDETNYLPGVWDGIPDNMISKVSMKESGTEELPNETTVDDSFEPEISAIEEADIKTTDSLTDFSHEEKKTDTKERKRNTYKPKPRRTKNRIHKPVKTKTDELTIADVGLEKVIKPRKSKKTAKSKPETKFVKTEDVKENIENAKKSLKDNHYKTALRYAEQGLKAESDNVELLLLKAEALFGQNKLKSAIDACKDVLQKDKEKSEVYSLLGKIFYSQNNYDRAGHYFSKANLSKVNDYIVHYQTGVINFLQGKNKEAKTHFKKSLSLAGNVDKYEKRNILYNIGLSEQKLGHYNIAIQNFNEALNNDPDHVKSMLQMGNIYNIQQNYDKSTEVLKKLIKTVPTHFEANYILGKNMEGKKDYKKALMYYSQALTINPKNEEVLKAFNRVKSEIQNIK